jgi:hypothetical protein
VSGHDDRQHGTLFWTAAAVAVGVLTGLVGLIGPWWSILLAVVSMVVFVRGPARPRRWVDRATSVMAGARSPTRSAPTRRPTPGSSSRRPAASASSRQAASNGPSLRRFFTDDTRIFENQQLGYIGYRLFPLGLALVAAGWFLQATTGSTPLLRFGVVLSLLACAAFLASDSEQTIREDGFVAWITDARHAQPGSRSDPVVAAIARGAFAIECLLILVTAILSALMAPNIRPLTLLIQIDVIGGGLLVAGFVIALVGLGVSEVWRKLRR